MKYTIRLKEARIEDIEDILHIERLSFKMPWKREHFLSEMYNPFSYFYILEDKAIGVIGYIVAHLEGKSLHISNIAVHPAERRKGYGTLLVRKIVELMTLTNSKYITLEVRVSNKDAIRFYEKLGFKRHRMIKGYYIPEFEDALVYRYERR